MKKNFDTKHILELKDRLHLSIHQLIVVKTEFDSK